MESLDGGEDERAGGEDRRFGEARVREGGKEGERTDSIRAHEQSGERKRGVHCGALLLREAGGADRIRD